MQEEGWKSTKNKDKNKFIKKDKGSQLKNVGTFFHGNLYPRPSGAGFGRFFFFPIIRMHLDLLLAGLGSVENCRLFLKAKLSQVFSIICMPSLVGASSKMSSQNPTAPQYMSAT